jgi:hypothetical protein
LVGAKRPGGCCALLALTLGANACGAQVIARLLPRFLRFLVLLLCVGFFYSLFGMSVFPERTSAEGAAYFATIGDALWNFVLMLTSNNMPGIAVTAWNSSQRSVLYILAAVGVSYFYFLNLVLAVVYDGYLDHKQVYSTLGMIMSTTTNKRP